MTSAKPQTEPPTPTTIYPTVGRMLHCYGPRWSGPRPAIVVKIHGATPTVNVNVSYDGFNDAAALEYARNAPFGNTFPSVIVFDSLSAEKRDALDADATWCEWPPRVAAD